MSKKQKQTVYNETVNVSWENDDCRVINVIRTTLLRRGNGVDGDPIRRITQYYTLDGELLFEHDPCGEKANRQT